MENLAGSIGKLFCALLAVGLLLSFGCASSPPAASPAPSAAPPAANPAPDNSAPAQNLTLPPTAPPAPPASNSPPAPSVDLTKWDLDAFAAANTPILCEATMVGEKWNLYIKGSKMGVEEAIDHANYGILDTTEKSYYIKKDGSDFDNGCNFVNEDSSSYKQMVGEIAKVTSFTCKAGTFGDEKFAISGKICTQKEYFGM
jgi:hypothetical protein